MDDPAIPLLKALRVQLATTLWPTEAGSRQEAARACRRILTELLLRETRAGLEQQAVARILSLIGAARRALPASFESEFVGLEATLQRMPSLAAARPALQALVADLQTVGTPDATRVLRDVVALELEIARALQALSVERPDSSDAPGSAPPLAEDARLRLRDFLRAECGEPDLELGALTRVPGGFSKQTAFLELQHNRLLPAQLVLRSDKANSPIQSTVASEFRILRMCAVQGVPVPRPIATSTDVAIIGAPFVVVERVRGSSIGDALDVSHAGREFGESLARALARLHGIPAAYFGSNAAGADTPTRKRMLDDIALHESKWRACGSAVPALELAYGWLKANIGLSDGRRSLIHRDVGCHNLLVDDGEISALLDWETAVIGNPAQDIGYVYHTAVQVMPWGDFLEAYAAAGGEVPSSGQVQFYRLWRAVWLSTLLEEVRTAVQGGHLDDFGLVYNSVYQYRRLNLTLHEVLEELML